MSHAATASASSPPHPATPSPADPSSTPPTPASSPSTPISAMSFTNSAAGDTDTPQSVVNDNDDHHDIGTGAIVATTASLVQVTTSSSTTMEALQNVLVVDSSLGSHEQQQHQQEQHQRDSMRIYSTNSNGDSSSSNHFHDNSGNAIDDNEDVDTIVTIRTSNVTPNNSNNNNNGGISIGSSENDHGRLNMGNDYNHYQGRGRQQQQISYDNAETEGHQYYQKQIIMFNNNNDNHGDSASGGSTSTTTSPGAPPPTARTNHMQQQQLNQNPNQNQHYLRSTIPSPIQPLNPSFTLPQELKKILYEVSKTGKCSSLPWTAASSKSSSSSSLYLGGGSRGRGRGGNSSANNNNKTSKSNEKKKRRALRNKNKKRNSHHHTVHQSNHFQKKRAKRQCNADGGGDGPDDSDSGGISLNQLVSSSLQSSLRPNDCSSSNNNNGESSSPSSGGTAPGTATATTSITTTTTTIITNGNVVQQAQQYSINPNQSLLSSSPDTGQIKMTLTSHQQQKQKRFNTENGEKYNQQPQQHPHLNEGRNDKKSHYQQQQSHQKGEDGDVSSLSSTLSYASKKSFSSTAGTYKQHRSRFHNKDFHPTSYTSSCSESISSKGEGSTISAPSSSASMAPLIVSLPFRTLRGALRLAVALVLEQAYKYRGGYKLSPAEKRRFEVLHQHSRMRASSLDGTSKQKPSPSSSSLSPREQNYFYGDSSVNPSQMDIAFTERRMRILQMLGGGKNSRSSSSSSSHHVSEYTSDSGSSLGSTNAKGSKLYNLAEGQQHCTGPPFTIQRVAEVLLMPERYYSQTHKLCNALEKLLLVTTPSSAFGGVKGGDTSQNRREEQELAAFEDKKVKDETEQRQRRLKQRMSLSSCDSSGDPVLRMNVSVEEPDSKRNLGSNNIGQPLAYGVSFSNSGGNSGNVVSMHNDHDHSSRLASPNALLGDSQMMLSVLGAAPGSPESLLPPAVESSIYQNEGGAVRANMDSFSPDSLQQRANIARFGNLSGDINRDIPVGNVGGTDSSGPSVLHPSVQRPLSPSLLIINGHHHQSHTDMQAHHSPDLGLSGAGQRVQMEIVIAPTTNLGVNNASSQSNQVVTSSDVADLEGRSSASNSDVDSESDDVSFDDSASDRSDGSDSGSGYFSSEPFTAARVMALNRMQQQHRREQYLQDRALRQLAASTSNFQPPPDSEYQSGDSIDSTMAEDSCGSDSSSSDFAD